MSMKALALLFHERNCFADEVVELSADVRFWLLADID
jgi:hypothetical protein